MIIREQLSATSSAELTVRIGTRPICADGPAGKLRNAILNRHTVAISALVIDTAPFLGIPVIVPWDRTRASTHGSIQLDVSLAEMNWFEPFEEYPLLGVDGQSESLNALGALFDDQWWTAAHRNLVIARVPEGCVALGTATSVHGANARLGRLEQLSADRLTGELTRLIMRSGHLMFRRQVSLPAAAIVQVESDRLILKAARQELRLRAHRRPVDASRLERLAHMGFDIRSVLFFRWLVANGRDPEWRA